MTKSELAALLYAECVFKMHENDEEDDEGYSRVAIYCILMGIDIAAKVVGVQEQLKVLLNQDPNFIELETHVKELTGQLE